MQFLIGFALFVAASAGPLVQCPQQNITITTPQWVMPPTLAQSNRYCTYLFNFPTDSYAVFTLSITGASTTDQVTISDHFNDMYMMDNRPCTSGCDTFNLITSWPGSFYLTSYTGDTTSMRIQMSVTLKKLDITGNIARNIDTYKNGPSTLLYLSDFQQGTSYTVTSNSSKVHLKLPVEYNTVNGESLLNGVFIYDGGKNVGTLRGLVGNGYVSTTNTVTLYAVNNANMEGAVFVTDQSNIGTMNTDVEFYSRSDSYKTGYVSLYGYIYPQAKEGAGVIVGDKDGKTTFTIQQLNAQDDGTFTYQYGGPTANHNGTASPLTNKDLPRTLSGGQMVTFYLSKGTGNIKFTFN